MSLQSLLVLPHQEHSWLVIVREHPNTNCVIYCSVQLLEIDHMHNLTWRLNQELGTEIFSCNLVSGVDNKANINDGNSKYIQPTATTVSGNQNQRANETMIDEWVYNTKAEPRRRRTFSERLLPRVVLPDFFHKKRSIAVSPDRTCFATAHCDLLMQNVSVRLYAASSEFQPPNRIHFHTHGWPTESYALQPYLRWSAHSGLVLGAITAPEEFSLIIIRPCDTLTSQPPRIVPLHRNVLVHDVLEEEQQTNISRVCGFALSPTANKIALAAKVVTVLDLSFDPPASTTLCIYHAPQEEFKLTAHTLTWSPDGRLVSCVEVSARVGVVNICVWNVATRATTIVGLGSSLTADMMLTPRYMWWPDSKNITFLAMDEQARHVDNGHFTEFKITLKGATVVAKWTPKTHGRHIANPQLRARVFALMCVFCHKRHASSSWLPMELWLLVIEYCVQQFAAV